MEGSRMNLRFFESRRMIYFVGNNLACFGFNFCTWLRVIVFDVKVWCKSKKQFSSFAESTKGQIPKAQVLQMLFPNRISKNKDFGE